MALNYTQKATLGRGELYVRTDTETAYEFIGNVSDFNYTPTVEKLERLSSRGGLKTTDVEVVTQQTVELAFTSDDVTAANLRRFALGTETAANQGAGSAASEAVTATVDRYHRLAYRHITTGTVVVQDVTDTTTYVAGTDYEVDLDKGILYIYPGVTIATDDVLHVSYDYTAVTRSRIDAGKTPLQELHILFISDVAAGTNTEWKAYVSLTPEGAHNKITDEWETLGFTGKCLRHASYSSDLYEEYTIENA